MSIFLSTFPSAFGLLVGMASTSTTIATVSDKAPFSLSGPQILSHIIVSLDIDRLGFVKLSIFKPKHVVGQLGV